MGSRNGGDTGVQAVRLAGSPRDIGNLWGEVNGGPIHDDMEALFLASARERGLTPDVLIARSQRFIEIAGQVAPHWIEEAHAIARAAGVDGPLYVAFIAGVYRSLFLHDEDAPPAPAACEDECTSYTLAKSDTAGNAVFFHKNRDNVARAQSAFVARSAVPGVHAFIAVSDASVLTTMMMVNERGLAGSADMTGLQEVRPRFRGVMNTFLLRHIAERASSCEDALDVIREFVGRGWYAGAAAGTHWLFVDKEGTILEVDHNAVEVRHRVHTEGVYFSVRAETPAAHALRATPRPVDFITFHNVSRDPSVCFESSISGMTVEIAPRHPEALTCAWVTLPARSLAFPLFMGCHITPLALVDGSVDRAGQAAPAQPALFEASEVPIYGGQQMAREKARALLDVSRRSEAADVLDAWVRLYAAGNLATLEALAR